MDRRSLLALATVLSVFASSGASACSPVLASPRRNGLQNQQVQKLFAAWWQRDRYQFQRVFKDTLMSDGSLMEAKIADELQQQSPIPDNTFDIFDRFFLDKGKVNRLAMIVNTEAGVIVACSEENSAADIQPDCSGMPMLHLFLVAMSGLNVRSVTHLATTATPNTGKFSIWVDG